METCHRGSYHSSSGYCSGGAVIVDDLCSSFSSYDARTLM